MTYILLRLKRFCGFLTGFVFFLSGILKLMDPVGASLVMKEYFDFLHLSFLDFAAMPAAVFLAFAETAIGTGLVTGVWKKHMAAAAIGFQGFFTLLTLILVIFNPEMDCGCFGEAIHLTHTQTFVKNLILTALLLTYYIPSRHLGQTRPRKYVSFSVVMTSVAAFMIYSLLYLPLNDYTAYHPGVSLRVCEKETEKYQALFTYEKDGRQEKFTIDELPDSTWTFISTETSIISEKRDDSASLSIYDTDGQYADSLALEGKVMAISVYDPSAQEKDWIRLEDFARTARAHGFKTMILTASPIQGKTASDGYFLSDYKTLISLNRSNGGVTYINNGFISGKWSKKSLPDDGQLAKISEEDVTETIIGNSRSNLAFQGFLLYVFAVMLLL